MRERDVARRAGAERVGLHGTAVAPIDFHEKHIVCVSFDDLAGNTSVTHHRYDRRDAPIDKHGSRIIPHEFDGAACTARVSNVERLTVDGYRRSFGETGEL